MIKEPKAIEPRWYLITRHREEATGKCPKFYTLLVYVVVDE
jgi:hypothetical protein